MKTYKQIKCNKFGKSNRNCRCTDTRECCGKTKFNMYSDVKVNGEVRTELLPERQEERQISLKLRYRSSGKQTNTD